LVEVGRGRHENWVVSSWEGFRVAQGLRALFVRWTRTGLVPNIEEFGPLVKVAFVHRREKDALKAKAR
jgi:hypothetical protein